jgi:hypothetical protein
MHSRVSTLKTARDAGTDEASSLLKMDGRHQRGVAPMPAPLHRSEASGTGTAYRRLGPIWRQSVRLLLARRWHVLVVGAAVGRIAGVDGGKMRRLAAAIHGEEKCAALFFFLERLAVYTGDRKAVKGSTGTRCGGTN